MLFIMHIEYNIFLMVRLQCYAVIGWWEYICKSMTKSINNNDLMIAHTISSLSI